MSEAVKVKRISPSQLEAYHRCPRRWAFEYKLKLGEGFSSAAQAGTETHKVLEDQGPWDKTWTSPEGKEYPVGEMAALLQAQTPEGVVAREKRWEVELDGVPFVGVTDFFSEDLVGDYKTTSNKRNAKTIGGKDESKDLLIDPQRLLYTRFVPTAKKMIWLYGAWADMSVTKREVPVEPEKDKERFKLRVLQPAETMLATPNDVDPLSLKANVKACNLFPPVGCPFKDKCFPPGKLTPVVTNSKEGNAQMSSLLERLKAKNAAAAAEASKIPEPEVAAVSAMPVTEPSRPVVVAPIAPDDYITHARLNAEASGLNPDVVAPLPSIIGTLYINAIPLTQSFENAAKLIAEAAEEVANDAQVPNALLIDYSKGGPAIAAQLRSNLSGRRIERLYLETKSTEGRAVMNVLMAIADNIVQGVF